MVTKLFTLRPPQETLLPAKNKQYLGSRIEYGGLRSKLDTLFGLSLEIAKTPKRHGGKPSEDSSENQMLQPFTMRPP